MRPIVALLLACLGLGGLAACGGQSAQDKAKNQVCDARDDIGKQIDALKSSNPTAANLGEVRKHLNAIGSDLSQIRKAQPKLNEKRKQEVKDANQTFVEQVTKIVGDLGTNLSVAEAEQQLKTAFGKLQTSYQQTFAKVDC